MVTIQEELQVLNTIIPLVELAPELKQAIGEGRLDGETYQVSTDPFIGDVYGHIGHLLGIDPIVLVWRMREKLGCPPRLDVPGVRKGTPIEDLVRDCRAGDTVSHPALAQLSSALAPYCFSGVQPLRRKYTSLWKPQDARWWDAALMKRTIIVLHFIEWLHAKDPLPEEIGGAFSLPVQVEREFTHAISQLKMALDRSKGGEVLPPVSTLLLLAHGLAALICLVHLVVDKTDAMDQAWSTLEAFGVPMEKLVGNIAVYYERLGKRVSLQDDEGELIKLFTAKE